MLRFAIKRSAIASPARLRRDWTFAGHVALVVLRSAKVQYETCLYPLVVRTKVLMLSTGNVIWPLGSSAQFVDARA